MNKFFLTTLLGLVTLTASAQTEVSPFVLQEGEQTITGLGSYATGYLTYEASEDQFVTITGVYGSLSVYQGDNEVSCYTNSQTSTSYFLIPANTKYELHFFSYASDPKLTVTAVAKTYTNAQTPATAVTASADDFFVPFIGGFGKPITPIYIKYTAPMTGKLTMHFPLSVSNLMYSDNGSTPDVTISGQSANGGWEATLLVDENQEYLFSANASGGMMATFVTAEVVPGASCSDAVKMKSGANELPAEAGSYWYTFTTPANPAQTFVVLTTEADLTGGKATISYSCSSTTGQISQNGELHLRLLYNANTTRVLEIKKATALTAASAVNMTFETPQLYDAFDTAPIIEADQTVTTPDFGGTYYYAITSPESGNYFLDVTTTQSNLPSGTKVELYIESEDYFSKASGTSSIHYNVEAGTKYVIKWTCPNDLRSLPFTVTFTEIQKGETAGDPIIAELGKNAVPVMSDVFFSYTADTDSWLIVTPAEGTPTPAIKYYDGTNGLTVYNEDGASRFQGESGTRYQIEFQNVTQAGLFTLAKREFATGETSDNPIIAVDGVATIPNAGGTYWVKYTATENGYVDVATNATYTTANTLGVFVGKPSGTINRMDSGSTYITLSFAVKAGDILYVRAIMGEPESDVKFTFTQREAGPGETVGTAIHIDFTENPMEYDFNEIVGDPRWYSIDLTEGIFNLVTDKYMTMYLYSAENTDQAIAQSTSSYPDYLIKNASIPTTGVYYLKLIYASDNFSATLSQREASPGETTATAIEIKPTANPYEAQLTATEDRNQSLWYSITLQPGDFNYSTTVYGSANAVLYKESNLNSSIATSSMNFDTWGQDLKATITEKGKYYLKISSVTSEMKATLSGTAIVIDSTVGVDGIEAEAQDAIYYNMEGVRVDNPEKGIYIRVIGNRRDKVVIR